MNTAFIIVKPKYNKAAALTVSISIRPWPFIHHYNSITIAQKFSSEKRFIVEEQFASPITWAWVKLVF